MQEGIIIKGIGGFYYVDTGEVIVECKARGKFRKTVGKPIVGDRVTLALQDDGTGYLQEIHARKNSLIRPAVANLDLLVVVASAAPPVTDVFLIDKVCAIAAHKDIDVLIVVNKSDVCDGAQLRELYEKSGFQVICASAETGEGVDDLKTQIADKVSAFAGNSGVGKSSLLNRLDLALNAEVGEISDRTQRGKHTTRHVELAKLPYGGYLADTPGFSAFEAEQMEVIRASELQYAFREFEPYLGQCKFTGCAHVKEKSCAVLAAVQSGDIAKSRHESYAKLYDNVKDLKEWEISAGVRR